MMLQLIVNNFLKQIKILCFLTVVITASYGQNSIFNSIEELDLDANSENNQLIYFHFKGCPPCKRMDEEVFTSKIVSKYLNDNFSAYSVYGFGKIEKSYREAFNVKVNPSFIILDKNNKELHRFSGYCNEDVFIENCKIAFTIRGLSAQDSVYESGMRDKSFMRSYVRQKEASGQLDSLLIFEYFSKISDSEFRDSSSLKELLHYGYYKGKVYIDAGSAYFKFIQNAFLLNAIPRLQNLIRQRLIFSYNQSFYNAVDFDTKLSLIKEIESLENGEYVILQDLEGTKNFAFIVDRYLSFYLHYNLLRDFSQFEESSQLFEDQIKKFADNHNALNSLAWGIYENKYPEDLETGILLIEKALKHSKRYSYFDTYASLLFKVGRVSEAKKAAEKAVKLAEVAGEKYDGDILIEIESYIRAK